MYQIWTQSSNPRQSYWAFNIWPNDLEHQTWREHRAIMATQRVCFRDRISCCIFKRGRLSVDWCWKRRQNSHFLTPVKIMGGVGEIYVPFVEAYDRTPGIHLMPISCAAAERGVWIWKIKKEKKIKFMCKTNVGRPEHYSMWPGVHGNSEICLISPYEVKTFLLSLLLFSGSFCWFLWNIRPCNIVTTVLYGTTFVRPSNTCRKAWSFTNKLSYESKVKDIAYQRQTFRHG